MKPLIFVVVTMALSNVITSSALAFQSSKPSAQLNTSKQNKPATPKPGTTRMEKLPLPESVMRPLTVAPFKVAKIDRTKTAAIESAAAQIDAIIDKGLADSGQTPQPTLKDDLFVRRVFLELGGRIPTYDEAKKFIDSKNTSKRSLLIDDLLESPDYVSHFYNYWADVLRLTERPDGNLFLDPYLAYIKDSIAGNQPYDQWVQEMLTADGKVWENPAVGFQLRDQGMPLPYVDNTVRVFLGKQIGCAQCHDHPFDSWTQKQFYELAAFTSGTQFRIGNNNPRLKQSGISPSELLKQAQRKYPEGKLPNQLRQVVRANSFAIQFSNRPLKLPHDYQYSDAQPNDIVTPRFLWDNVPSSAETGDLRQQFATWITHRDNRQFARNIANRMWKKMMGLGVVEPVDDFNDNNKPSDPILLDHLTAEILRLNFDLREFIRIIANTKAYQRQAVVREPFDSKPFDYAGPVLKRMTAEQLWDSLITLVAYNQWSFQRPTAKDYLRIVDLDWSKVSLRDAEEASERYSKSLFPPRLNERHQKLCGFEGQLLVRASEIPTPLPLGHFLRQFGQSDRETIEGGREVATVPQILAMFNGPITHVMLKKGSVVYDNVVEAGPRNSIDVLFISVLSRRPTADDREIANQEIDSKNRPEVGYGNVLWALLNTREFLFIQ